MSGGDELGADERFDSPEAEVDVELSDFLSEMVDTGKLPSLEQRQRVTRGGRGGPPSSNTGVKGVLSDYQSAKHSMQQHQASEREQQQRLVAGTGATIVSSDDDDFLFADDDDIMERMMAERLREMEKMGSVERANVDQVVSAVVSQSHYGSVFDLTQADFVEAIDQTPANTSVIIHLYEDYIAPCIRINAILTPLAGRYPRTKFCRIRSKVAQAGFDEVGLPVLLVYRGGELVRSFVHVTDDLPSHFDFDDVHQLLLEHDVVALSDGNANYDD
eukprot:TRINITY_DN10426_c0_g1_i1.p1 TRINITY_DN10426_c0_g1~~TRINITY_DN10426_c0_g1_i1.p1  ORF type:complete len:274 (-),score=76.34 TRINITY_DN10426_c0_g1_i1:1180-2001(-)